MRVSVVAPTLFHTMRIISSKLGKNRGVTAFFALHTWQIRVLCALSADMLFVSTGATF